MSAKVGSHHGGKGGSHHPRQPIPRVSNYTPRQSRPAYAKRREVTLPIDEVPLVGPAASPNSRAQSAMVKLVEAARIITTATGIGIGFAGHYVPFSICVVFGLAGLTALESLVISDASAKEKGWPVGTPYQTQAALYNLAVGFVFAALIANDAPTSALASITACVVVYTGLSGINHLSWARRAANASAAGSVLHFCSAIGSIGLMAGCVPVIIQWAALAPSDSLCPSVKCDKLMLLLLTQSLGNRSLAEAMCNGPVRPGFQPQLDVAAWGSTIEADIQPLAKRVLQDGDAAVQHGIADADGVMHNISLTADQQRRLHSRLQGW